MLLLGVEREKYDKKKFRNRPEKYFLSQLDYPKDEEESKQKTSSHFNQHWALEKSLFNTLYDKQVRWHVQRGKIEGKRGWTLR